ncbi:MAG: hypothetical protein K0Q70_17 [Rhodospirillales bacterium]|jgi:hypothetical protein|nr:hypothetical protein [Rhodospirillales bacterium]
MTESPLTNPFGEISEAARAKARKLRILRYRLLFIFLLLPALLVTAIVFDWIWELSLSGRMTREYLIAIYGGLIAVFVLVFLVVGYVIRKRMRHEEEEALKGPVPVERALHSTVQPIPMSTDRKSRS